jgi:hypothetical protein
MAGHLPNEKKKRMGMMYGGGRKQMMGGGMYGEKRKKMMEGGVPPVSQNSNSQPEYPEIMPKAQPN